MSAVIHQNDDRYTLLFIGPNANATNWAKQHKVQVHPVTGAIQVVPIPDPNVPAQNHDSASETFLDFARFDSPFLMSLGIPDDWVELVQKISDEETFFSVYEKMPEEAAEYLYSLALGEDVTPPTPVDPTLPPQHNEDNLRRLYVLDEGETLSAVLSRPFEQWMLFLHPSQRSLVSSQFNGPSKITGSAGTGKTVVALHRARQLAAKGKRVLLTTYTNRLKRNLQDRISKLCNPEEASLITVETTHRFVLHFAQEVLNPAMRVAFEKDVAKLIENHAVKAEPFEKQFLIEEWTTIVDRQGVKTWEEYRDIQRVGRGTALGVNQREQVWKAFGPILVQLGKRNQLPSGILCRELREKLESEEISSPVDAVTVDEVQDLNPQEIRLLGSLCSDGLGSLMLIGDAGQRIYPGGFSLRSLGLETRGRSRRLTINYRTTQEIERAAYHLRTQNVEDFDGGTEQKLSTHNLLRGPKPKFAGFETFEDENQFVISQIQELIASGVLPAEIGIFARIKKVIWPFFYALKNAAIPVSEIDDKDVSDKVSLMTMHGAKGLEFRYVFIVACRSNVLPAPFDLRKASDDDEREIVLQRERTLLYVAMTRARDQVWITWKGDRSPFLDLVEEHADVMTCPPEPGPVPEFITLELVPVQGGRSGTRTCQ